MRIRTALLVPAVVGLASLVGCSALAGGAPARPTATVTATETVTATPTAPTAVPVPSPSPTAWVDPDSPSGEVPQPGDLSGPGCTDRGADVPAGAARTEVFDVDGDGKADTEFLTTSAPFRYGIETSAGGVYTADVALPARGVHSAWITPTDSGFADAVVVDDGSTAVLLSFHECRLRTIRTTDGAPFTMPLRRSDERSTGVACTNQNGGTLIAAEETRRRDDGTYDVFQALVQFARASKPSAGEDQAGLDDFAPPARYTGLAADDPRVVQASGSFCWTAP